MPRNPAANTSMSPVASCRANSIVMSATNPTNNDRAITRQLLICNKRGLHARASAKFVQCVERHDAQVTVSKDGQTVNGIGVVRPFGALGGDKEGLQGDIADLVNAPVRYLPDFSAVAGQVAAAVRPGDVVVTMGAGDVTMLGPEILSAIAERTAEPREPR